ncbi:hypothetical protein [Pseudoduganella lutea]|uniref:Uncharacterized protein n=1 Tax=Pseudoduganella lutea TaxID=321985 RepID=A0A4P6L176_9BURK|nr:hypothetical protein [Pseudoduganella lutea]QBE64448.1 hypothetical protein EWM63_16855 [Pseudoduganella lutea]
MGYQDEYKALGVKARWLTEEHAKNAYAHALQFSDTNRYGLNEKTTHKIERHIIESRSVADIWLKTRLCAQGTLQIIYGPDHVCVVDAEVFLKHWQDIFVPARDDAIILHNIDKTVFFYCHEEELEVGIRGFRTVVE